MPGWPPGRIWTPQAGREGNVCFSCLSFVLGCKQAESIGTGVAPLQPHCKMLRKHLGTPVPCLRRLGKSRCVPAINQLWKQQGLGDVQLITRVISSARSRLRQKEGMCQVPLAESSGTNKCHSKNISAALLSALTGTPVELHLPGRTAHHGETLLPLVGWQNVLLQWKRLGLRELTGKGD